MQQISLPSAFAIAIFLSVVASPTKAQTVPPEIAQRCQAQWGTDYRMQLYCREKQMEALKKLQSQDGPPPPRKSVQGFHKPAGPPQGGPREHYVWQEKRSFAPLSSTAISITGPIKLSGNPDFASKGSKMRITFDGKTTVALQSAGASYRQWDYGDAAMITAETYTFDRDPGPLRKGNRLCGEDTPATFIVFYESQIFNLKPNLNVLVYSGDQPPVDGSSPSLCSSYSFVIK